MNFIGSSRLRRAAACALLAAWWWPKWVMADAVPPLRIGFICPFSGGSADFGRSARLGAQLAVSEINAAGGYLGAPVELVARDDEANPALGRQWAEELVLKQRVDFTVAFCNAGVAMKALDVFQTHRHLLMVPVSTGSGITAAYPPAQSYVFRLSARDTLQAGALVGDLLKRGYRRLAVFADNTGYGDGGLKDVTALLQAQGLTPVQVTRFELGVKSLVDEMKAAKAAGADALLAYTVGPEQAVIAQARQAAGFSGPHYGPWPLSFHAVAQKAGAAVEGAVMVQTLIQDLSNERRASFMARLKAQAGREPLGSLMAAAQTYDAVHLMLRALFQTRGDRSADALKAALEHLERPYVGVVTTYDTPFSPADHDAFTSNMVWLGVWRKGEVQYLDPQDAQRAGLVRRKKL